MRKNHNPRTPPHRKSSTTTTTIIMTKRSSIYKGKTFPRRIKAVVLVTLLRASLLILG